MMAGEDMADRTSLVRQAVRLITEEALEAEVKDLARRQDLAPLFQGYCDGLRYPGVQEVAMASPLPP